jgi:chorismate mutase
MRCRGIRGATTVDDNTREDTLAAAKELLQEMVQANGVQEEEIACIFFTTTPDINRAFPAAAARELGLSQVPMLCGHEMNVHGSLPMCLRILILFNTRKGAEEIVHVYIRGARELRSASDNQEGSLEV